MQKKELFERVYNTDFSGLEDFDPVMVHLLGLSKLPKAGYSLKKMIYSAVGIKYTFKKNSGSAKKLFIFSSSYMNRKDYKSCFDSLTALIDDAVIVKAERKWHISPTSIIRLFKSFAWYKKLKNLNIQQKMFIISQLYEGYNSLKNIQKLTQNEEITVCTTFCDTHLVDSLAAEYFNKLDVTTVTLQHGHFADVPEIDDYSTRIHFTKCISDYLLTFGEYTNEQAVRCGMNEGRVRALGMLKHIGKVAPGELKLSRTNTFGVIMSFDKERKANIAMLKIANEFASISGMEYIVRFHPSSNPDDYIGFIDKTYGSNPKLSMDEFSYRSEFLMIGKSTMFIEMMYDLKPAFIYASEPAEDSFPGIDWCKFKNSENLNHIYQSIFEDTEKLKGYVFDTRDKLCRINNVAENYIEFYKGLD
ncbi:MAG: hypothetical protein J1G06_01085 [Oscillospiraceae bacterium]|nr:hypothetical protein [Oscillospiraceae bacterium]